MPCVSLIPAPVGTTTRHPVLQALLPFEAIFCDPLLLPLLLPSPPHRLVFLQGARAPHPPLGFFALPTCAAPVVSFNVFFSPHLGRTYSYLADEHDCCLAADRHHPGSHLRQHAAKTRVSRGARGRLSGGCIAVGRLKRR